MAEIGSRGAQAHHDRILSREPAYRGWARIEWVTVETEVDGRRETVRREVHDHGSAAAVLAYDPVARTAVLARQLRVPIMLHGLDPRPLEAVAGLLEGDEPEACVRREAMEEVGVTLGRVELVAAPFASPGALTERSYLFLGEIDAAAARQAGGGLVHESESIEVVELPLAELARMSDAGELLDMKTIVLVEALRRRRPELFE